MPEEPYDHNQIELKWHARWQNATALSPFLYPVGYNELCGPCASLAIR